MAEDPGALSAAKEEAARQGVWLAAMVLAVPVLAWVERKTREPDAWHTARMRAALELERFCMESARSWAALADRAHSWYERERA